MNFMTMFQDGGGGSMCELNDRINFIVKRKQHFFIILNRNDDAFDRVDE